MALTIVFPQTYIVTMEKSGCERSKRVRVTAHNPYDAMAAAQMKHAGWMPVDVEVG